MKIDPTTADALYVGIATDTGQFVIPGPMLQYSKFVGSCVNMERKPL